MSWIHIFFAVTLHDNTSVTKYFVQLNLNILQDKLNTPLKAIPVHFHVFHVVYSNGVIIKINNEFRKQQK